VRELEIAIERAVVLTREATLDRKIKHFGDG
jgi:hypothetical protein